MATHGRARTATIRALSNREPFQRSGFNMRGIEGKVSSKGRLPLEWWAKYQASEVTYTVMSYRTAIAWVESDGTVTIPEEKYSNTTTHHQNLCRVYL